MQSRNRSRLSLILRRAENVGLFASVAALILVEAGYIAWLERLPALPRHGASVGFLDLPPWYDHPRAEVTLLLTVLGGLIAWSTWCVLEFVRASAHTPVGAERRAALVHHLKTAGICALVTGADMLLVQLLRT